MAFDWKEFGIVIVAVIIAAYVLNFLGFLGHNSPMNLFGGTGARRIANSATRSISNIRNVNGGVGQTSVPAGSIGATQLASETAIRPL